MTNGDRIRSLSNEDLAKIFLCGIRCGDCDFLNQCKSNKNFDDECMEHWINWLNQEADF